MKPMSIFLIIYIMVSLLVVSYFFIDAPKTEINTQPVVNISTKQSDNIRANENTTIVSYNTNGGYGGGGGGASYSNASYIYIVAGGGGGGSAGYVNFSTYQHPNYSIQLNSSNTTYEGASWNWSYSR